MSARLVAISGLGVKGPACFLLEANGVRILIDAGIGPDLGRAPDLSGIGNLDAVVLSHAHPDHAGAVHLLPSLESLTVHATGTTLEALGPIDGSVLPIQGSAQIAGLEVVTGRAGHCAGGVWIRFDVGGGFLYMGDHCAESSIYAYDPPPVSQTIVVDASYGFSLEKNADPASWIALIVDLMPVVLPVPAEGRGLEILGLLVDAGVGPVSVDEPVRTSLERCLGRDAAYLKPGAKQILERAASSITDADPGRLEGVAIVSDGEASQGLALEYVKRYEASCRPSFLFTGYTGAGTASARMVESGRARKHRWNVHPTFRENLALVRSVRARNVLPAFLDSSDYEDHRADFLPAQVVSTREFTLDA